MSENKFIAQLKGNTAPGSVLEIQDKGSKTSFANMPSGTSDAIVIYSDKRNNATAVLKGAMNWKVNGSTLSVANPAGDGSDYTGQTDVAGISDQQGNNLWINASYTVPADGLFLTKNTKWVLKLCGDNLIVNGSDTAEFTVLITAGNSTNITKKFFVAEQANQFCKELVIDFAESNTSTVKLEQGDTITLKLLSDIPNASARIYQGMTTLTLLQRAVDAENVISKTGSYEEVVDDINYLEDHIIVKSATMPTASADLVGEVYQYMGATAYPYEHGYVYECVQTSPGVYAWQRLDVQPGGSRGRFLSLWNCATGLAMTNPPISPYEYNAGDYFIVSNVSSGTNYKPSGTEYVIGTPSTAVETEDVFVDDTYFFDGTSWKLQNTSNDIKDLVDTKVSKDGSSIMSGPLKFRAGSFVGAIAGGLGDGVSFYKLKSDNTIDSEVASLTKTNGFIPGTTNALNIGSSSLKWKDAYVGRVITSVLNNGANINVPTTGGTLALTSDIGIGIHNITNCVTEIPQDINLKLNNGTLTLKAGSKVYVPNGAGVFDEITVTSDKTITAGGTSTLFVYYRGTGLNIAYLSASSSGSTTPTATTSYGIFYNTTDNKVYFDNGSWIDNCSLPIAIISTTSGQITSIDQVFNGFGYIGSTVFALPGVKGLVPNGRNIDGTLKNNPFTVNTVLISTFSGTYTQKLVLNGSGMGVANATYNEITNYTSPYSTYCIAADITTSSGTITALTPKTAFHAVDYNDYQETVNQVNTNTANIALKQDEATAVNYDNISNCITEIPQDIKLELTNGTLTLKAGSKVYKPNGSGVFDKITVPADKTFTYSYGADTWLVFYTPGGSIDIRDFAKVFSGSTEPAQSINNFWYDTTNNVIKKYYDSAWHGGYSFPIAIITTDASKIVSIDQVFNGFGFIGSTVFALPGIKVLIPNGRNADGTLKSSLVALTKVATGSYSGTSTMYFGCANDSGNVYFQNVNSVQYDPETNTTTWGVGIFGYVKSVSEVFSDYTPKTAFHAVDYNDTEYMANQAMPSNKYVNLSLGATGSIYSAPSDGYFTITKQAAASNEYIYIKGVTNDINSGVMATGALNCRCFVPVSKGDYIQINYTLTGSTSIFRFVYANGAK